MGNSSDFSFDRVDKPYAFCQSFQSFSKILHFDEAVTFTAYTNSLNSFISFNMHL